jgi:hypothetical protein
MLLTIINLLILIVGLAICFYLIMWVLEAVGIAVPDRIRTLILVLFVLIAIAWIFGALTGAGGLSVPVIVR